MHNNKDARELQSSVARPQYVTDETIESMASQLNLTLPEAGLLADIHVVAQLDRIINQVPLQKALEA